VNVGTKRMSKVLSLLFVTGSVLVVGQAGAVTENTQKKHERVVLQKGGGGNTGNGGSTQSRAGNTATDKRPCHAHEGTNKKRCIKVYRENQRRANMKWPPNPSVKESSYIGGLGMYRQTYGYGQRATGYRWVSEGATKQEQIAIAVASFPITYGWSGWGCGSA